MYFALYRDRFSQGWRILKAWPYYLLIPWASFVRFLAAKLDIRSRSQLGNALSNDTA